jgi:glycosyltransferase involved in cell wall biosynthesis
MKILHITTHLNRGGITSYISSLAVGMQKKGHTVIVASSSGEHKEFLLNNNIQHVDIPLLTKSEVSPLVLISYFVLKKFIANNPIDIIHAHTRVSQVLAWFLSKKFKIPFVTTCHGFFKPRWHRRRFPCWGDKTIAISREVKRHLIFEFKVDEKSIKLVHNGIDLKKFRNYSSEEIDDIKKEIGIRRDCFVVGVAARFSIVKGLEYLIKAIPEIIRKEQKALFLLIGYGKEESKLKQLAKDLKVEDKVFFFNPTKETFEYLCVMNIFVMPSIQEGLGISILEAQAQRVPVVASDVGGIPDIIQDKVTGILTRPKDELSISKAILELMHDKSLSDSIKNRAYEKIIKEFSLEQMMIGTENVYKELL